MRNVPVSKVKKILSSVGTDTLSELIVPVKDADVKISIKRYLSPAEMYACVHSIVDNVFMEDDDGNVVYTPELFSSAVVMSVITYYTNLDAAMGIDLAFKLMYGSDLYREIVDDYISQEQFADIIAAAHEAIDFKCKQLLSDERKKLNDAIALIDQCAAALQNISGQFSDIDEDTMGRAVKALSALDADKIIDTLASSKKK